MKRIERVIRNVPQHWVGDGFPVRSLFSYAEGNEFDPFLLLDYAGPQRFAPAEATRGVGEHPHRGFETVTIVYQGELEHRDSSGGSGSIGPGDVQWMTAAAGVVHEEFHSERFTREGGTLEMVQLWVNLPAREKLSPPRYQELLATNIPTVALPSGAGSLRVIAGEFAGIRGPARTVTPMSMWDIQLAAGGEVDLPVTEGHTALFVSQSGDVRVNDREPARGVELALFSRKGDSIRLRTKAPSRGLLLAGEPLGEPVVGQGPFVMNTREEIRQAIQDYQSGGLGRLS